MKLNQLGDYVLEVHRISSSKKTLHSAWLKLKESGYGWFAVVRFFLGKKVAHLTQNNAELQKIDLFSYSRNGFE